MQFIHFAELFDSPEADIDGFPTVCLNHTASNLASSTPYIRHNCKSSVVEYNVDPPEGFCRSVKGIDNFGCLRDVRFKHDELLECVPLDEVRYRFRSRRVPTTPFMFRRR